MEPAVYGLFSDPHAAQGAFEALRDSAAELGFEARHIISISSEPFDEFEFGARESKTPMPWLAALGGLAGAASGFGLTALTQEAYPLPTGGMPIVAHWTNAIIIYEMAMLGAVLAILLALLAGARQQSEENGERSEEHTSELQSRLHLVCRLLLGKKKKP